MEFLVIFVTAKELLKLKKFSVLAFGTFWIPVPYNAELIR